MRTSGCCILEKFLNPKKTIPVHNLPSFLFIWFTYTYYKLLKFLSKCLKLSKYPNYHCKNSWKPISVPSPTLNTYINVVFCCLLGWSGYIMNNFISAKILLSHHPKFPNFSKNLQKSATPGDKRGSISNRHYDFVYPAPIPFTRIRYLKFNGKNIPLSFSRSPLSERLTETFFWMIYFFPLTL